MFLCLLERGVQHHSQRYYDNNPLSTYLPAVRCTVSAMFALAHRLVAAPGVGLGVVPHYGIPYPVHRGLQALPSVDPCPSEQLPGPRTGRTHCSLQPQVHAGTQGVCFHLYLRAIDTRFFRAGLVDSSFLLPLPLWDTTCSIVTTKAE
jgi:hypothetical protein